MANSTIKQPTKIVHLKFYPANYTWENTTSISGLKYMTPKIVDVFPELADCGNILNIMVQDFFGLNPLNYNFGGYRTNFYAQTSDTTWSANAYIELIIIYEHN